MNDKKYIKANKLAWNEAALVLAKHSFQEYMSCFSTKGYVCFDDLEINDLNEIGIEGKDVAQLGCSKGIELISIKNLGAQRCVGFDISDNFLKQAREINKAAQTDCEFIQTDIYEIDAIYNHSFDLVYISIGVLCWMPDIKQFFSVVSRLLRPQGMVCIHEQHPLLDMLSSGDADSPVSFEYSYFMTEPVVETEGIDYLTGQAYDSEPNYCFHIMKPGTRCHRA